MFPSLPSGHPVDDTVAAPAVHVVALVDYNAFGFQDATSENYVNEGRLSLLVLTKLTTSFSREEAAFQAGSASVEEQLSRTAIRLSFQRLGTRCAECDATNCTIARERPWSPLRFAEQSLMRKQWQSQRPCIIVRGIQGSALQNVYPISPLTTRR